MRDFYVIDWPEPTRRKVIFIASVER